MPAEPTLDVPALSAPIPGDDPAGGGLPFELMQQLDDARKEVDPAAFAPDDPLRPTDFQKADWPLILKLTQDGLTSTAKDLKLAARLTEAATKLHGFAGLRDGLTLLRTLVTDAWDRLAPRIDDPADLDLRATPFELLDDPDHGFLFPGAVRQVPIVSGDGKGYGWQDWKRSADGKDPTRTEAFNAAVAATPAEAVQDAAARLDECQRELEALLAALKAKLAGDAPTLTGLRTAVADCRKLAGQILDKKGAGKTAEPGKPVGPTAPVPTAPQPTTVADDREGIYRLLADAADRLQRIEPHSPIPYLIRRCVALGRMPFPEMIRSFVRDGALQKEMERELGLPDRPE